MAFLLGTASAVLAVQGGGGPREPGPCDTLTDEVASTDSHIGEVVRSFSLHIDVPVPQDTVAGNFYCFGRHRDGERGDILGVAIEDATGQHVWIIRNDRVASFASHEWDRLFTDHGWDSLSPTAYGWTSRAAGDSAAANLWDKLAAERRR